MWDPANGGGIAPGVWGLLGMASGFGQAAMPQPYKGGVPFGAALGMGLGGFGQGVQNAYKTQLEQQQARGAQLANVVAASALPLTLARNKSLTDIWSNPDTLRAMMKAAGYGQDSSSPTQGPTLPIQQQQTSPGGGSLSPSDYASRMVMAENGSGPPGAKNPLSSATGNGQFIDPTWLPLARKTLPQTKGMTDQQVLALRADPTASAQMIVAYANENAPALQAAGLPANATTLALAHHLGPTAAISTLKADRATPMAQILPPDVIKANPDLANQTAGGLVGSTALRFGNAPVQGIGAPNGAASTQPDASTITPGNAALLAQQYEARANQLEGQINAAKNLQGIGLPVPLPAGDPATLRKAAADYRAVALAGPTEASKAANAITMDRYGNMYRGTTFLGRGSEVKPVYNDATGKMEYGDVGGVGVGAIPGASGAGSESGPQLAGPGPGAEERLKGQQKVQEDQLKKDGAVVDESLAHVIDNVTPAKQQLFQLRQLAENPDTATGAAGQLRSQFKNWVQTFAPDFVSSITGDATPSQEFNKIALMGAGKQERGDLGARGGFRAMELYLHANPNLDMQPQANHDMANALLISHQFHADYAQGATDFYQNNYDKYVDPKNHEPYQRLSKYDQSFNATMKPELYAAAISAINGKPSDVWAKGLSSDQVKIVGGILQRTDPSAAIDMHGQMVPVSKFTSVIGPSDISPGASNGR